MVRICCILLDCEGNEVILYIVIGGFLGACLRYAITSWLQKYNHSFPLATLVINLIGSCLIGISAGIGVEQGSGIHMFTVIGSLGAFTTFSTFAIEALDLMLCRQHRKLLVYVSLSLAGSSFCCMLSYQLVNKIWN